METLSHAPQIADVPDGADDKVTPRPLSPAEQTRIPSAQEDPLPDAEVDSLNDDGQISGQDNGYNSSASSTQNSSSDVFSRDLDEEELAYLKSGASSRSSVSSIPASILIHPPDGVKSSIATGAHNYPSTHSWVDNGNMGYGKTGGFAKSVQTLRQREAAFRKPSSVRAMQMHTEDEGDDDDDLLTPPRRRGHRTSDISMRSAGSPLRRSPYYSPSGLGSKQKVKKEYPLVLLHCTLLPPSLPIPTGIGTPSQKLLEEVLPPQYWRRWRLLGEKVGSGVLRDRGILISHPQDMYDLLEERLLESLELQRPRLDKGHFLGHETDSEKEDQSGQESATDDEQGEGCPDCGGRVIRGSHGGKKWEIKVFAANGLMRAGAWAAAWKEMEKVDVEVGLWLPPDVRRELEKRILEDQQSNHRDMTQVPLEEGPNINSSHSHEKKDVHDEPVYHFSRESHPSDQERALQKQPERVATPSTHQKTQDVDLQTLLINYIRVLASDRRNIAISILGVLVVLLALGGPSQTPNSGLRPFPQEHFDSPPPTDLVMSHYTTPGSESLATPASVGPAISKSSPSPSTEGTDFISSMSAEAISPTALSSSEIIEESMTASEDLTETAASITAQTSMESAPTTIPGKPSASPGAVEGGLMGQST
ncbi:hypothetical protein PHISCL_05295 [Aspergillus sclerotialis]|uniref:Flavoprotein oxygenase n=1 Tax=Aspergillus sclerotialis TaxID=2070753 RepID=A0A3A2ZJ66_9EURO|nr:hypothetical protein PHISCL_05295 [Aspergillus sclerotialis]